MAAANQSAQRQNVKSAQIMQHNMYQELAAPVLRTGDAPTSVQLGLEPQWGHREHGTVTQEKYHRQSLNEISPAGLFRLALVWLAARPSSLSLVTGYQTISFLLPLDLISLSLSPLLSPHRGSSFLSLVLLFTPPGYLHCSRSFCW